MKRTALVLMVLSSLLLRPSIAPSAEFIKIASFNIAEFGEGNHPQHRHLKFIAKMLVDSNLDLIAIQEVGVNTQAETQVNELVKEMNKKVSQGKPKYFGSVTPVSGDERCAVIFRSPVIMGDDITWLDDDKNPNNSRDGGKVFFRIPPAIPFRAENFDFQIVILHLAWGNLERRADEVDRIQKFLADVDESEDDWIVLGDMNRYGKLNKSSSNKPFDQLLKGSWESRYRFPLLEAITDPHDMKVYRAKTDENSTTVAKSKNIYDQFVITQGAFNEFGTDDPKLGDNVGIIAFDQKPKYKNMDHNSVKYSVSDHRPIWIRFRIDGNDDD